MQPWSIVYIKDTINVSLFNILDSVIDRFHMPLLFILAGMATYFSLQSRTVNYYIKERVRKLLIPALFGCIFLNPMMTYIYLISKNEQTSFMHHFVGFFTKNPKDFVGLEGSFTPAHLWFIIFLFVFSLVGLPLFIALRKNAATKLLSKLSNFFHRPLALTLLVIPVTLISAINILDDKNPLVYFSMFFIGFLLVTDASYQKALNRDAWIYFILSILLIYIRLTTSDAFEPWSIMWIAYGLLDKATRIIPVFALIGLANRFINKNTPLLSYLSKASFPIYVIHMLINTIVGFYIIKLAINPILKYLLIVSITFALCFLGYEIIRRSKILRFIFSIKSF